MISVQNQSTHTCWYRKLFSDQNNCTNFTQNYRKKTIKMVQVTKLCHVIVLVIILFISVASAGLMSKVKFKTSKGKVNRKIHIFEWCADNILNLSFSWIDQTKEMDPSVGMVCHVVGPLTRRLLVKQTITWPTRKFNQHNFKLSFFLKQFEFDFE